MHGGFKKCPQAFVLAGIAEAIDVAKNNRGKNKREVKTRRGRMGQREARPTKGKEVGGRGSSRKHETTLTSPLSTAVAGETRGKMTRRGGTLVIGRLTGTTHTTNQALGGEAAHIMLPKGRKGRSEVGESKMRQIKHICTIKSAM